MPTPESHFVESVAADEIRFLIRAEFPRDDIGTAATLWTSQGQDTF